MILSIPPEFAKKRITRLKCTNCRYEFNLVYSKYSVFFSSFKNSNFFVATCPNCGKKKQDLYVLDREYDPAMPTYVEPSLKLYYAVFLVVPIIAIVAIFFLMFFYPALDNTLLPALVSLYLIFIVSSVYYRVRKLGIKGWKLSIPPEWKME